MTIKIDRAWRRATYTISRVYINGKRFGDGAVWCACLEDTDRGLSQTMQIAEIRRRKVFGKTAIPSGYYDVTISYSPKFRKRLPLVRNVIGFSGIRFHAGNTPADTDGCLLFGANTKVGELSNSRYWCNLIQERIEKALKQGEKITLIVK